MSIVHALKWSFLSEVASKAVQPLVFVILARLLTPEDYGVVAAATMVISFSQIFWEAGMGKAIIQYQGDRIAAANAAFWINNILGVVVAAILVLIAEIVSNVFFHDPRVASVLQVLAIQVLLSALVSVHTALLQKDMQFKHLFWVRLATVAIPGLVSIPLALYGSGYWALIAGTLVGQVIQVMVLWRTSLWKPRFSFDSKIAKRLAQFGGWVAATGILAWFYIWADSLIVGMYLGSHELGLYRTGNAFVMMIYGFIFGPLTPVIYSFFSGIQDDRKRLKKVLLKVTRAVALLSIPIGFLLYISSQLIAEYIFGTNWQGVDVVIGILALAQGLAWLVGINSEAYKVIGRPNLETLLMLICLIFYIPVYLAAINISFETFLWARIFVVLLSLSVHWVFMTLNDLCPTYDYLKKILAYVLIFALLIFLYEYYGILYLVDKSSLLSILVYLLISITLLLLIVFLFMWTTIVEIALYFKIVTKQGKR